MARHGRFGAAASRLISSVFLRTHLYPLFLPLSLLSLYIQAYAQHRRHGDIVGDSRADRFGVGAALLAVAAVVAVSRFPGALGETIPQSAADFTKQQIAAFVKSKASTVAMLERLAAARGESAAAPSGPDGPRRRAYSSSTAIQFHLDYDLLPTTATGTRIRDEIMPVAVAELSRRMGVRSPASGNLFLTPYCNSQYLVPDGCTPGEVGCETYCASVSNTEQSPGQCGPGIAHKWSYFGDYEICDNTLTCTTTQTGKHLRAPVIACVRGGWLAALHTTVAQQPTYEEMHRTDVNALHGRRKPWRG